jgi:hypothetical protein
MSNDVVDARFHGKKMIQASMSFAKFANECCVGSRYCSKECQGLAWPSHKELCKLLSREHQRRGGNP